MYVKARCQLDTDQLKCKIKDILDKYAGIPLAYNITYLIIKHYLFSSIMVKKQMKTSGDMCFYTKSAFQHYFF